MLLNLHLWSIRIDSLTLLFLANLLLLFLAGNEGYKLSKMLVFRHKYYGFVAIDIYSKCYILLLATLPAAIAPPSRRREVSNFFFPPILSFPRSSPYAFSTLRWRWCGGGFRRLWSLGLCLLQNVQMIAAVIWSSGLAARPRTTPAEWCRLLLTHLELLTPAWTRIIGWWSLNLLL